MFAAISFWRASNRFGLTTATACGSRTLYRMIQRRARKAVLALGIALDVPWRDALGDELLAKF